MGYIITVELTDKGKQICGSAIKTFRYEGNVMPTDEEVTELIEKEFMLSLVKTVVSVKHDFSNVKVQDILKIVIPSSSGDTVIFGTVASTTLTGKDTFDMTLRIDENVYGYGKYNYWMRFNIEGFEISKKRKYRPYIEIPTPEELSHYNELVNLKETYHTVKDLISYKYINDSSEIPPFISPDMLIQIKNMLVKAKAEYETLSNLGLDDSDNEEECW